jgi:peptidoglycan/LPS O-acetylase OafA/YrhL
LAAFVVAYWLITAPSELSKYGLDYTYFLFLGWFPLFVIGMLAFELYDFLKDHQHARSIGLLAIVSGLITLVICASQTKAVNNVGLRIPIGLGYAALLVGCALHQISFLRSGPLLFYGRISYSLYLVHVPIIYHSSGLYLSISSAFPPSIVFWICLALTFFIVTPVAFLTYRFIEAPGTRLGSRLLDGLWRRHPRPAF